MGFGVRCQGNEGFQAEKEVTGCTQSGVELLWPNSQLYEDFLRSLGPSARNCSSEKPSPSSSRAHLAVQGSGPGTRPAGPKPGLSPPGWHL